MKKRTCILLLILILAVGVSGFFGNPRHLHAQTSPADAAEEEKSSGAPPPIAAGETLTLAQVIAITRANQPAIMAAKSNVIAGQSRVGQAEAPYYPQINAATGYDRLSPEGNMYGTTDDKSYDRLAAGIRAEQMLYDFGKTATRVEIEKTNLDSSRADLNAADDWAVYKAKLAYYDMLKIARNKEVAAETVKQFEKHLEQAKGFFEAGVKPKYDVTKADVDLSSAKLLQIQVKNNLRLARVVLNNAMGQPTAPEYQIEDTLTFVPFTLPFAQALPMALSHRPDLKALMLKQKMAQQTIDLARKGDAPTLSGNAGAAYNGDINTMDEGWSAGVALTIPIFNGHLTRHQVGEAQANADVLAANVTSLQQTIYKEVEQNYLNLHEAEERISVTQLTVQQAEENSRIASGRYSAGVGSPIEVTDADILLVQAKADHIQALYDYRLAQTSIEQAIGSASGESLP